MKSVLVVEDDTDLQLMFRMAFEGAGWTVCSALDQPQAETALHEQKPDAVILDNHLDGKGMELLDEIRHDPATATIPVIMVTGDPTVEAEAVAAGVDAYHLKPVDLKMLVQEVEALAAERRVFRPRPLATGPGTRFPDRRWR